MSHHRSRKTGHESRTGSREGLHEPGAREEPGAAAGPERGKGAGPERRAASQPRGAGRSHVGPSTSDVEEGLEGSIMGGESGRGRGPTGMGSEAAEGLHGAASERAAGDRSGAGAVARERKAGGGAKEEAGSEPLVEREQSENYGGRMGEPRK